jgi:hypothetical protein
VSQHRKENEDKPQNEKIFIKPVSDKGLLSRIYKEPLEFNNNNSNNSFKNGQKI